MVAAFHEAPGAGGEEATDEDDDAFREWLIENKLDAKPQIAGYLKHRRFVDVIDVLDNVVRC